MNKKAIAESERILVERFGCHTVLLYGSQARGDSSVTSDIDMLGIAPSLEEPRQYVEQWQGSYLDLFVFPENKLEFPDESSIYLVGAKVLREKDGKATQFLNQLHEIEKFGPEALTVEELKAKKVWARKMLDRARAGDPEGNYRRMWLLTAQLEDYFHSRKLWYRGSKQSLEWLKKNDPEAYVLFVKSLDPSHSLDDIERLLNFLWQ